MSIYSKSLVAGSIVFVTCALWAIRYQTPAARMAGNEEPSALCVIFEGVHDLKAGDRNTLRMSLEPCNFDYLKANREIVRELVNWTNEHVVEMDSLETRYRRDSCSIQKLKGILPFSGIDRMEAISATLSKTPPSFEDTSAYMKELVILALRAENSVAQLEEQYGKCLCHIHPTLEYVSWGAWCAKRKLNPLRRKNYCNYGLADYLSKGLFRNTSVADVGAGAGTYSQYMLQRSHYKPAKMKSIDGGIEVEEATNGLVQYANLARPLRLRVDAPVYDWVMSLEVAEHIPRHAENTFVKNLARHASEGIVISWATPGQGGVGHVNERAEAYVHERFAQLGFTVDPVATSNARKASLKTSTAPWFSHTVYVLRRNSDSPSKFERYLWDPVREQLVYNVSI